MTKYLKQALKLKFELDKLRPIDALQEAKIMQKFRLDWNFHSNNLEGNSLTFGETKTFLMHGITASGKPFKDYCEIEGHNEAIKWVEEVIKKQDNLTQYFIRSLHKLILKEPYQIDAITLDGKATKKMVKIGEYKTSPNHVKTKTGEIFYFASPEETPAKMGDLIKWYEAEITKKDLNPIILATTFHYKFVRIHPFDDGNGRISRILMNFILMQFGYPPAIIKTTDKENYFNALIKADEGEIEPFIEYIAKNLIHSLEIMIKGAKGEDIEELSDLDRKLVLLEQELKNKEKGEIPKSKEAILNILDDSVARFYKKFIIACEKFDRFYDVKKFTISVTNEDWTFKVYENKNINDKEIIIFIQNHKIMSIGFLYQYMNNKFLTNSAFRIYSQFNFEEDDRYIVSNGILTYSKTYSQQLDNEEIDKIIKTKSDEHLKALETKINQQTKINNEQQK